MTIELDEIRHRITARLDRSQPVLKTGLLRRAEGVSLRALLDDARVGDMCRLRNPDGSELLAEIVGVDGEEALLSAYSDLRGVSNLTQVVPLHRPPTVSIGQHLLGHAIDALGRAPGLRPGPDAVEVSIHSASPPAMGRQLIGAPFTTGVRAIDGCLLCARGQRVGIFGGAGLGKSTLMSMLVNQSQFDVGVIALIGERGREVREFWERHVSPEIRAKTVLVYATSDRPAVERRVAALVAMAIAETFRDRGANVMLVVDSLTRLARAQRDIGLAAGEPPVRRGFPPSTTSMLAEYVERAGPGERGTITGFFTVLVEGEIDEDPIAEEVKSLLDGHMILSRKLADEGHYPAIDVLASRSRLMTAVADRAHNQAAVRLRSLVARHREIALLIEIGEYRAGQDPLADEAIEKRDRIQSFLRQETDESLAFPDIRAGLIDIAGAA